MRKGSCENRRVYTRERGITSLTAVDKVDSTLISAVFCALPRDRWNGCLWSRRYHPIGVGAGASLGRRQFASNFDTTCSQSRDESMLSRADP